MHMYNSKREKSSFFPEMKDESIDENCISHVYEPIWYSYEVS